VMVLVIPPIFVIVGLLDVWVPREMMVRSMGPGSGLKGLVLAFLLGSAAAGPLYAAFPVAQMLLRKGATFRNSTVLLGAWSTTKIPLVLFEVSNMGARFALTRLAVNLVGIATLSWLMERLVGAADRKEILAKATR
jgi:uncharacterized membrane protein YraQ (UPF0718 family)